MATTAVIENETWHKVAKEFYKLLLTDSLTDWQFANDLVNHWSINWNFVQEQFRNRNVLLRELHTDRTHYLYNQLISYKNKRHIKNVSLFRGEHKKYSL